MTTEKDKTKGRQWDGKSRPSDDLYRKRFDEIFGSKSKDGVKRDHVDKDHANNKESKHYEK